MHEPEQQGLKKLADIGSIRPDSTTYAGALERSDAAFRAGALTIFAGAGISMAWPSCVPGGEAIRDRLLRAMTDALRSIRFDDEAARIRAVLGGRPIELLLDSFTKVHGRQALGMLATLDVQQANRGHYCIARLAHGNSRTRLVTLNFDVLIEAALDGLECSYNVQCPLGASVGRWHSAATGAINILKPHGSFPLPGDPRSVDNLATTMSEIRDRPDERTADALGTLVKGSEVLLVVGYRGEDWDVLPLLSRLLQDNPRLHLVWVAFHQQPPSEGDRRALSTVVNDLSRGARDLLTTFAQRTSLLVGDPADLLATLVVRNWPQEARRIAPKEPCSSPLVFDPPRFVEPTVETVLVTAHALQDIARQDCDRLLEHLGADELVAANPRLQQSYANLAAWRRHIRAGPGDQETGIALRESAIRLNRRLGLSGAELASELISTGYQLLSYAKPRRLHLRHPLKFLYYRRKGRRYLKLGSKAGSELQKGRAAYYRADYRHAFWMPLLLLGHGKLDVLRKAVFRFLVCRAYDKASRGKAHLMDREYFFLRRLEAQILAGTALARREELDHQLRQIEAYFMLTRQMDHLRNLCATRSLLAFASDPNDPAIDAYLECALLEKTGVSNGVAAQQSIKNDRCVGLLAELVSSSHDTMTLTPSGHKRYSLFRRFMRPECLSFWNALKTVG